MTFQIHMINIIITIIIIERETITFSPSINIYLLITILRQYTYKF